jgi:hypothetical protein
MESAARRRGAYDGEYLRAGLRLCARGGRREAKRLVKLDKKELQERWHAARRLIKNQPTS